MYGEATIWRARTREDAQRQTQWRGRAIRGCGRAHVGRGLAGVGRLAMPAIGILGFLCVHSTSCCGWLHSSTFLAASSHLCWPASNSLLLYFLALILGDFHQGVASGFCVCCHRLLSEALWWGSPSSVDHHHRQSSSPTLRWPGRLRFEGRGDLSDQSTLAEAIQIDRVSLRSSIIYCHPSASLCLVRLRDQTGTCWLWLGCFTLGVDTNEQDTRGNTITTVLVSSWLEYP